MAAYLVTGGAGFIGSHLVHALLARGDDARVLDDFSTGRRSNLAEVEGRIELIEGSICDREVVARAMAGVECCFHQAAIPSVPRSVADPWASNRANVEGTLNVFLAARDAGVRRVVFASSSSVYGNTATYPVHEELPLAPISPYGVSKAACEMYARAFAGLYDIDLVGLRYFNVFGPRQDPESQYAAVVPLFIKAMLAGERPPVNGDGGQSRDFTFVENVVAANLAAANFAVANSAAGKLHVANLAGANVAAGDNAGRLSGVYNVACGAASSVLDVVAHLNRILGTAIEPVFRPARPGDIRRSLADIRKASAAFGYRPQVGLEEGLRRTVAWMKGEERS